MKVIIDNKEIRDNVFQMFLSIEKDELFTSIEFDKMSDKELDDLLILSRCLSMSVHRLKVNRQTELDISKFEEENPHIASLVKSGIITYTLLDGDINGSSFIKDNYHYKNNKDIMIIFTDSFVAYNFSPNADGNIIPYKEHQTIDDAILHIEKYLNDKEKI